MDLIYDSGFTLAAMPTAQTLAIAESIEYVHTSAVTGFALFDVVGTVKVQASDDDFSSTVYDSGNIVCTGEYLLSISSVSAAKWRILAVTETTTGLLYLGVHASVPDPTFPVKPENSTIADDRRTIGGALYSVVQYTAKTANLEFIGLTSSQLQTWRDVYDATQGYRVAFVIDPVSDQLLITAPSNKFQGSETDGDYMLSLPGVHQVI